LTYDPARNVYYALVDNDGDTQARFYTLDLPLAPAGLGAPRILKVTTLRNAAGTPFTGANFDGEGMVLLSDNELLISSETEPSIRRVSLDGNFIDELVVPTVFDVAPAGYASINETFESLAITPSGKALYTATEGPLEFDGQTSDGRQRVRILRYDAGDSGFEPGAQNFYLAEPGLGVSELAALSEEELIVLERGFAARQGNTVRLYRVTFDEGQDVSNEDSLAAAYLQPRPKTLLLDLANCPAGGAQSREPQSNPILDNFEGLALGPTLPEGRVVLLVSDDNFNPTQVTRIIALILRP
jgi:hypothetical protein